MDREVFEEIAAEFHEALPALIAGEPDRTDLMIPLSRAYDWEEDRFPEACAVKAAVVEVYGLVGVAELFSNTRETVALEARMMASYILVKHAGLSQGKAGKHLRKDRTVTLRNVRIMGERIGTDPAITRHYQRVLKLLGIFE